ncbi:hypothetical protein EJ05DRAFT_374576 [Pseudovirgaria hyperparasitica]|uniref:Uncharacterized protein n=1 Tax=Pseudovirgaria hyperparasitica TaxID=470096 RepID=A0A6A6W571_9PEZI|nr:uncharacterized protein EJ05DRAFT_374576 [Pseudovirgaria hyperparasitica]KAF2758022.1 hypothetical protein EJ05DRAFT_374576 [Pseudovirgaria hyperparasitica]
MSVRSRWWGWRWRRARAICLKKLSKIGHAWRSGGHTRSTHTRSTIASLLLLSIIRVTVTVLLLLLSLSPWSSRSLRRGNISAVLLVLTASTPSSSPRRRGRACTLAVVSSTVGPWRRSTSRTSLPRLKIATTLLLVVVTTRASFDTILTSGAADSATTRQFLHERLIFAIDSIATTDASRRSSVQATSRSTSIVVPPIGSTLTVRAITSHMSGIATYATNDIRSKVPLLWAIIFPVPDLTTILTSLIFIIT